MLTMVEVRTVSGQTLPLPLQDVTGGYVVREIDGLDPVKASIVSSRLAQVDGTVYQASRRDSRNIIIRLGFEPDYVNTTIRDLRQNLYRYLMPKSEVILRFYLEGEAFVDISGRVESFETNLFAKDPQVDISVMCFDPDFYSLDTTLVTGQASSVIEWTEFEYEGGVETGFEFEITVNRSLSGFSIYHEGSGNQQRRFEFDGALLSGDVVTIDSRTGKKGATRLRGGTATSVLYGVTPASNCLELYPGPNSLRVQVQAGTPVPWKINYVAKYGGL